MAAVPRICRLKGQGLACGGCMNRKNRKTAKHLLFSIAFSFIVIYVLIFAGAEILFESGDPILLEIAAAIVIGVLITIIYEAKTDSDEKIR